jgi:DNA-binding NarL/FixJ family response regulator
MQSTQRASLRLTQRELQVLKLIADGHSTKSIADELHIAYKTADTHRTKLMNTLGIHSIAGLVRYAIRIGLVETVVFVSVVAGWLL